MDTTATNAVDHLLTPTTLLLSLLLTAPLVLTSIYSPPNSRLRRLGRAVSWLAGPLLGMHLGYRLGTLLPSDVTVPQPGMDLHQALLTIFTIAGMAVGVVVALGLTQVAHNDTEQ